MPPRKEAATGPPPVEDLNMTRTPARPDLQPHHNATRLDPAVLVEELRDLLGAKLAAYLGGVKETRAVRKWAEGTRAVSGGEDLHRLRVAYQAASLLGERDSNGVVQAWFQGLNPALGDRSPARLLREGAVDEVGPQVLAAARRSPPSADEPQRRTLERFPVRRWSAWTNSAQPWNWTTSCCGTSTRSPSAGTSRAAVVEDSVRRGLAARALGEVLARVRARGGLSGEGSAEMAYQELREARAGRQARRSSDGSRDTGQGDRRASRPPWSAAARPRLRRSRSAVISSVDPPGGRADVGVVEARP